MEVSLGAFECSYLGAAKAGQSNDARAMAGILSSLQAGEKQKTTLEGEGKPVRTEMKTITYFHSDTNDKKIFAFKAMVDSAGLHQICHVFKAPSKAKASEIAAQFGKAFQVASGKITADSLARPASPVEGGKGFSFGRSLSKMSFKRRASSTRAGDGPKQLSSYLSSGSIGSDGGKEERKCGWNAIYCGTVPVETKGSGNEIVEVSVKKIIEDGEMQQFDCAIHMTAHNIKVVEAAHGNVLETHFMRSISSTAVYGEKKTVYIGIVSKHAVLGLKACTIFETGMATASDICESVSDAFKELMAEPNPFAAPDGQELIRPPQSLAGEEIRRHFLTSTGVVGAGQFGEVHLAELNKGYITPTHKAEDGTMMVAVKMLKLSAPASDRTEFVRECEAMLELKHSNLIALHGVSVRRRPWLCIIELMAYGDILSIVKACQFKGIELNLPKFRDISTILHKMLGPASAAEPERDIGALLAGVKGSTPRFKGKSVPVKRKASKKGRSESSSSESARSLVFNGGGGGGGRRGSIADDAQQTSMATLELARGNADVGTVQPSSPPQRAGTMWDKPGAPSGSRMAAIGEAAGLAGRTDPRVGRRCTIEGYACKGTVRFAGVHNTTGSDRFLVELDEPVGKNNGTVKGFTYAAVRPKHGVLIHPNKVTLKSIGGGASGPGLKGAGRSLQSLSASVSNPAFQANPAFDTGGTAGRGPPPPVQVQTYNEHMVNQGQQQGGGGGCCTIL
eukprot:gene4814-12768_t